MLRRLTRRLCASVVTLDNGTVLSGKFHPTKPTQLLEGVARLADGRVYSGTFDPSEGHPLPGAKLEEDGDCYCGQFSPRWQREGDGEAWLSDGTHYRGTFRNDELVRGTVRMPHGSSSEVVFEGTLRDECFVHGKLRQHDFVYEGDFEKNQPHGKGRLVFATGAVQEGTFYAGKLHGPDCKLKLDGGFVYVGEFIDGVIRRGTLYTPTYTYDGEFNAHGRAHGEGVQTFLAHEPRLIFTGVWDSGAMVRGVCTDEYGHVVDWQNDHAMQSRVLGESVGGGGGEAQVAVNSYCSAKLREADQMHREMDSCYVEDAEQVARSDKSATSHNAANHNAAHELKTTQAPESCDAAESAELTKPRAGRWPSKMDLGYEGGVRSENAGLASSAERQMGEMRQTRNAYPQQAEECRISVEAVKECVVGEINENMAKMQFYRHKGAQQLAEQRVEEQFERFMRDFDKPLVSSGNTSRGGGSIGDEYGEEEEQRDEDDAAAGERAALNITSTNAPWKSFTPMR